MGQEFRAEHVNLRFERWLDDSRGDASVAAVAHPPSSVDTPAQHLQSQAPMPPLQPTVAPPQPTPAVGPPEPAPAVAPSGVPHQPATTVPQKEPQREFAGALSALTGSNQPASAPVAAAIPPAPKPAPPQATDNSSGMGFVGVLLLVVVVALVAVYGRSPPPSVMMYRRVPTPDTLHISPRMKSFLSQINPKLYGDIAVVLFFLGAMFTFKFLSYELSMLRQPEQRKLLPQLCVAGAASHCLGFGSFFLLTWAGVYI